MRHVDWSEIQTIICVARRGSLSAAARELSVNHSTVLRRIQQFEEKHHVNVFVREPQGYRLSRHGQALLRDFEQIDQVMSGMARRLEGYDAHLQGKLTLTSTENLFASFLQTPVFNFAKLYPGINLELLISNQLVNMTQLEADIAIRPMTEVPAHFFGHALFELSFYFYAPHSIAKQVEESALEQWPDWIGYSGALASARVGQLLRETMNTPPVITANSFDGVASAARAGLGIALLPSFVGDSVETLHRLSRPALFSTDVYVIAPEELKASKRVTTLMHYLNTYFNPDS
ncbi:LysR family transcriptional regulator [Reinekea sp. G2M2-21]|uniref:LysR family transcriptional regulator n=1 Tax=Reinekea sp. G2M2-21 TaxID=2788942 RepID=UPI0018AB7694|nr:LysR family transcriptional regulator [Reinekea sp. G2M2-21]